MPMRDLIPWSNRGRDVEARRSEEGSSPLFSLHREINRLFDDAFRGFGLMPFGSDRFFDRAVSWPNVEVSETDKEVKVTAEVAGLEEKDIQVAFANGVLAIKGEKKSEMQDESKMFSERYYGRFERRIPIDDVDEDKIAATFKNGVLTVTLPKTAQGQRNVKLIPINSKYV
jgi:HSP20 family protein